VTLRPTQWERLLRKPSLSDFMAELGSTADEVADSLRKLKVKGKRAGGCTLRHPLAVAINTHANSWGGLKVSPSGYMTYDDCQIMDPKPTKAVCDFSQAFHEGAYPDLVE